MCSSASASNAGVLASSSPAPDLRTSAQRPASSIPPIKAPPRLRRAVRERLLAGASNARRPAKLSAFTKPTATSSPRASSSSLRSRCASCCSSSKNSAPWAFRHSSTRCAREDSSGAGASLASAYQVGNWRRGSSTIGVPRTGPPLALSRPASRVQTMRPERHSSSSQVPL